jgi:hypothetical protein
MGRLLQKLEDDEADGHDVSKELFLGLMMLMLCLGIMILNVASPVWRVHQHDPEEGDVLVLYTPAGIGQSLDGEQIYRRMGETDFHRMVHNMITMPDADLHLFLKGGSNEQLLRHAAYADSLLSTDPEAKKVRTGVYVHGW